MYNIFPVEAFVSGHFREVKRMLVTRAGHLRECRNTECVWEWTKMGFCGGSFNPLSPNIHIQILQTDRSIHFLEELVKRI